MIISDKLINLYNKFIKVTCFGRKKYQVEYLKDEDQEHSIVFFDDIEINKKIPILSLKKYVKGCYDDDDLNVKVLFPTYVKDIINKIGIKKKNSFIARPYIYYNELILNNDWIVTIELIKLKEYCSMNLDTSTIIYAVVLKESSDNKNDVSYSHQKLQDKKRSDSYGFNYVSEKYKDKRIIQYGFNKILYKLDLLDTFTLDKHEFKIGEQNE